MRDPTSKQKEWKKGEEEEGDQEERERGEETKSLLKALRYFLKLQFLKIVGYANHIGYLLSIIKFRLLTLGNHGVSRYTISWSNLQLSNEVLCYNNLFSFDAHE